MLMLTCVCGTVLVFTAPSMGHSAYVMCPECVHEFTITSS